jgi:hypothetical protein
LGITQTRPVRRVEPRPVGSMAASAAPIICRFGAHGRKLWWDEVQAAYGITERGGVELLAQTCAAMLAKLARG